LELLSLYWSLLELLSLYWSLLDLLSGSWSGSELGGINVGLEVQVGGVSWVDKGIKVAAWNLNLRLRLGLRYKLLSLLGRSHRSHRSHRSWLRGDRDSLRLLSYLLGLTGSDLGVERSALQSIGSLGDVATFQDPEPVLASGVPDGDGLAVLVNVAVLAHPLPVSSGLLPEHRPVLLGEGGAEPAVSSVKSLFFQNLGILCI
jgi:hypothetical protein